MGASRETGGAVMTREGAVTADEGGVVEGRFAGIANREDVATTELIAAEA